MSSKKINDFVRGEAVTVPISDYPVLRAYLRDKSPGNGMMIFAAGTVRNEEQGKKAKLIISFTLLQKQSKLSVSCDIVVYPYQKDRVEWDKNISDEEMKATVLSDVMAIKDCSDDLSVILVPRFLQYFKKYKVIPDCYAIDYINERKGVLESIFKLLYVEFGDDMCDNLEAAREELDEKAPLSFHVCLPDLNQLFDRIFTQLSAGS